MLGSKAWVDHSVDAVSLEGKWWLELGITVKLTFRVNQSEPGAVVFRGPACLFSGAFPFLPKRLAPGSWLLAA